MSTSTAKTKLSLQYTCQQCKKREPSTHQRSIYTKAYMGPCGDSFCYASCDMATCRPIVATVCDKCAAALAQ